MRLSMKDVNEIKRLIKLSNKPCPASRAICNDLIDTIEAQHDEIESLKNWNACTVEDHEKLVESYKRKIELEEEVEQYKMFTGEIEPDEDFIEQLQGNRTQLVKWLERCAWHVQKVNELDQENQLLKCQIVQAVRGNAGIANLAEENIKLQAQAAAMKEALHQAISCITSGRLCSIESINNTYSVQISASSVDKWAAALTSDASLDLHNPSDVEALKKAKEALISSNQYKCGHCGGTYSNHNEDCLVKVAIDTIDKALGGEKIE